MEPDNYELTQGQIAAAMNEWMRRYIADPGGFEAEFQTVAAFLSAAGEPDYGASSAAYLLKLHRELSE